ncbi:MAG: MoaD/ThiS family protein [Chloroflexia bacterium]
MGSRVTVRAFAPLGSASGKSFEETLSAPATVGQVLRGIARKQGFYGHLFSETGEIRRGYTVLLNGYSIYHQGGIEAPLEGDAEIVILAFASGG